MSGRRGTAVREYPRSVGGERDHEGPCEDRRRAQVPSIPRISASIHEPSEADIGTASFSRRDGASCSVVGAMDSAHLVVLALVAAQLGCPSKPPATDSAASASSSAAPAIDASPP